MYRTIFLDLDDTLLDFGAAEQVALSKAFSELGIAPTPELLRRYAAINQQQWERFERGEVSRDIILVRRFALLFDELNLSLDPAACEDIYRAYLGQGHYFVEGAQALLEYLAPKYNLYLATNGLACTQYSRIESANISHYFKEIFISEAIGYHKPEREYFEYCFAHIPAFSPEQAFIVGDSLTSDILGGANAGIHTCWLNPSAKPRTGDIIPDYEIRSLAELHSIL